MAIVRWLTGAVSLLALVAMMSVSARASCQPSEDYSSMIFWAERYPQASFVRARVIGVETLPREDRLLEMRRGKLIEHRYVILDVEVIDHIGGERYDATRVLLGSQALDLRWRLPTDLASYRAQFPNEIYLGVYRPDRDVVAYLELPERLATLHMSMPVVIGDGRTCASHIALWYALETRYIDANGKGYLAQLKKRGWLKD
jgi:hypothetical protein